MSALAFAVAVSTGLAGFTAVLRPDDKTYPVRGATPQEITAGVGGSGLYDSIDTGAGAASTGGSIRVEFSTGLGAGGCRLSAARVTAFVRETLPGWDAPDGASAPTRAWWAKTFSAMKKHEDGHRDRWLSAAQDAAAYLERMAPAPSCSDLAQWVDSEAQAANTDAMRRQVDWDARTRHGQAQYDEAFGHGPR